MTLTRLDEIKHILKRTRDRGYQIFLMLMDITKEERKELGIFDEIEHIFLALNDIDCKIGMDIRRKIKGIDAIVLRYADDYDYKVYSKNMVSVTEELFENYEKALSAAIDEALELLK